VRSSAEPEPGAPAAGGTGPLPRAQGQGLVWLRALWLALRHLLLEDGLVVAGYVAFAAVFALFPFVLVLLALAGFFGQGEAARESIALALDLVPPEVAAVLRPVIAEIRGGAPAGLLGLGILVSLWFASSGMEAIRHVLDRAYGGRVRHNVLLARLQSLVLVVLVAVAILVAMVALVGVPLVRRLVEWLSERDVIDPGVYLVLRYGLGLTMLLGLTLTLHLVLPAVPLRLPEVLPGTVLSVLLWALAAELYSAYLASLPTSYSVTYGSLAGIVVTLFFFYISAAIFIFGAQFNGALRELRGNRRP
jgi:membrane protein